MYIGLYGMRIHDCRKAYHGGSYVWAYTQTHKLNEFCRVVLGLTPQCIHLHSAILTRYKIKCLSTVCSYDLLGLLLWNKR